MDGNRWTGVLVGAVTGAGVFLVSGGGGGCLNGCQMFTQPTTSPTSIT